MSARSKVAAVAAPEAVAARKLAPGTSADDTRTELERRRKARAAGARIVHDDDPGTGEHAEPAATPAPAPSSSSSASSMDAVHTGGGFLLGLGLWVVFVNYMQGGVPQVKKLAAAKLLNRTGG